MIEAKRGAMLKDPMMMIDRMLARDAGIAEPPEFTWRSLMDMSDTDVATNAKMKAEALQIAIMSGMIDEDDGRKALDGDPVFGALPGEAPELPEPETPLRCLTRHEAEAARNPLNQNNHDAPFGVPLRRHLARHHQCRTDR